jgi:hypothetical protein
MRSREEVLKEFNGDRFATMQDAVLAMADRIRSLEATPERVTDEMVERAQIEYRKQWEWEFNAIAEGPISADARKRVMKAALTAAITEGTPDAA